jgi:hypothetical protein
MRAQAVLPPLDQAEERLQLFPRQSRQMQGQMRAPLQVREPMPVEALRAEPRLAECLPAETVWLRM